MSCKNILERLLNESKVSSVLSKSNTKKTELEEFQTTLHQLGFDKELNWDVYGADGYYGGSCISAVKAFCSKNGINSDGTIVTDAIAKSMLSRYDILDELQDLYIVIKTNLNKLSQIYKRGSSNKGAVASLQTLLNDLGYGEQLKWDKYKNDGDYGESTAAAVKAFMDKQGISGDSNELNTQTAEEICNVLGAYFGANWYENSKADTADEANSLVDFSASNFQGKKVKADINFVDSLNKINNYAKANNVKIHVTSSWRANAKVAGAIVKPAKKSNHMAGHAIDMNIAFAGGWANSEYLKKRNQGNWDASVAGFIKAIRDDSVLRWGGDFKTEDPVHIDDKLNIDNPSEWEKRYLATQQG
jgi:peptidoglycan hydrolase-like protein with peptidoglycan-binding domain